MRNLPKFVRIATIPVEDFVAIMDIIEDDSVRKNHWFHLILNDMLVCPATQKKVAYCGYDALISRKNKNNVAYHFNFYSEEGDLFTIDHKIPKSMGGNARDVNNIQPMECFSNWNKSNQLIHTE